MPIKRIKKNTNQMKSTNLIIRISEQDKKKVRELSEKSQMSMSELVTYLIRREYDKLEMQRNYKFKNS